MSPILFYPVPEVMDLELLGDLGGVLLSSSLGQIGEEQTNRGKRREVLPLLRESDLLHLSSVSVKHFFLPFILIICDRGDRDRSASGEVETTNDEITDLSFSRLELIINHTTRLSLLKSGDPRLHSLDFLALPLDFVV
uniref:Uncharacterized protein n=1 Tax=Chromera velia CCMP2878 TaxID=1169474 RepID=A0A0G4GWW8_9ALVE|eukprot:Cvel_23734.t1-p1 / transcript=Cvel_23734.t1 / gene=Cvel_23734 / organism=Chromera_velia_CCMP2878 / gene_product=hypothetical protein / transcript_product=hypothetical protein / location=Cvel_scaffold2483:6323-6733(-) / protein_length=137 / sequence_SO=supercontig / SO=protein_coding / is_pseudo=false